MDWPTIRAHYTRLFNDAKRRGESQETIARRGDLRQNKISNLMNIKTLGPQVETFIKAVEGLGLRPSEFFGQIESTNRHTDSQQDTQSQHSILSEGLHLGNTAAVAEGAESYGGRSVPSLSEAVDLAATVAVLSKNVTALQKRVDRLLQRSTKARAARPKTRTSRDRRAS